jgi:hypothetical protein
MSLIPTKFQVMGCTVEVQIRSAEEWGYEDGVVGIYDPMRHKIQLLQADLQMMEHAYFHELVHCVLHTLGREKLSSDEQLVDTVAGLLHQAMKTAVYNKGK